jgi:hypothetical protein
MESREARGAEILMYDSLAEIVVSPVRWFIKPFASLRARRADAAPTPQERHERETLWWLPVWEFVVHAAVGTLLFVLIALGSWLPTLVAKSVDLSPVLAFSLNAMSNLLMAVDVVLFTTFVARTTWRAARELLR